MGFNLGFKVLTFSSWLVSFSWPVQIFSEPMNVGKANEFMFS